MIRYTSDSDIYKIISEQKDMFEDYSLLIIVIINIVVVYELI